MESADLMLVSFKEHLRVETVPAEGVCLVSERGVTALSGPSIEKLAPLLDGTRTAEQVTRELSADLSAGQVAGLLARLSDAGLLAYFPAQAAGRRDEQALAYWHLADADGGAASAVASSPVEIIATGNTDPEVVAAVGRACGLTMAEPGSGAAALSLVLCDDYLDPALRVVNADHLVSRRPWLLAKMSGMAPWVGPVFQPGAGPCWTCLVKRLEGNRLDSFLMRRNAEGGGSGLLRSASLPASRGAALHIALLETVKWLGGVRHEGQGGVYVLDTLTMHGVHHQVTRRPQCAACGDPGLVAAQVKRPVTLVPRRIATGGGNGHRVMGPEKVLESYGHLVDPVTGIVPELRRDPGCPEFLYAYVSGRNRAISQSSFSSLRARVRARSGGKGATELEAKVGALCEAVERYCGTRDGDEPTVYDSYRGLGDRAVHPAACQLFHERQFAGRERWNASCSPFHHVPEPFDENAVIGWTPLWSLLGQQQKLLPTGMLYYSSCPERASASVLADSNGNASGACLEDAILQGFFELVERDAVALWWYNRTRQPAVDLDSFDDPWVAGLSASYARMNRQVWALDLTSDLGIPVMAAISRRCDKPAEDIMFGFGAHFDPRIALRRALTELGQMIAPVAGAKADGTGYGPKDLHLTPWWTSASIANQPYLVPDSSETPRTAASYGYLPTLDLDLPRMCATVRGAGLDILVLDQTRPDIQMPVVKVVVPGLRHFWPRFAPGRLYDVPVRLGRLARPTAYEDLNPIPIYL
jgi:ribosomal protein S12 methylthiotransferase accessory factor